MPASHVAGIIAGDGSASEGKIKGIAPECELVILKVLDRKGNGRMSNVLLGLQWLLDHHEEYKVRVVNISVGAISDKKTNEKSKKKSEDQSEKQKELTVEEQTERFQQMTEKFALLGIPVIVDRSEDEQTDLAKYEWIKVYGVLFGCEDQMNTLFDQAVKDAGDDAIAQARVQTEE